MHKKLLFSTYPIFPYFVKDAIENKIRSMGGKSKMEENASKICRIGRFNVVPRKHQSRSKSDFNVTINQTLKQHIIHYQLMTNAYIQLELNPASQNLLMTNTHLNLFQFMRLPFGVSSAPLDNG